MFLKNSSLIILLLLLISISKGSGTNLCDTGFDDGCLAMDTDAQSEARRGSKEREGSTELETRSRPPPVQQCSDIDFRHVAVVGDPTDEEFLFLNYRDKSKTKVYICRAIIFTQNFGHHFVPGHAVWNNKTKWTCFISADGRPYTYTYKPNVYEVEIFIGKDAKYAFKVAAGDDLARAVPVGTKLSNRVLVYYSGRLYRKGEPTLFEVGKIPFTQPREIFVIRDEKEFTFTASPPNTLIQALICL